MRCLTLFLIVFISGFQGLSSQNSLESLLKKYNDQSIPYIKVAELSKQHNYVLLDAREQKEYEVSHIKNAVFVGYDYFNIKNITAKIPNKNQQIIVYCSLGIRSEVVAKKMKEAGYTNIYNLYGGIFEWSNQEQTLLDTKEQPTNKVHTFNKDWSKWLTNGEKIYEK